MDLEIPTSNGDRYQVRASRTRGGGVQDCVGGRNWMEYVGRRECERRRSSREKYGLDGSVMIRILPFVITITP